MPTMYVTYAYISNSTRHDDVDFHVSRRYDSNRLWEYVQRVVQRARERNVRLLEFTVFDGGREIWNGVL